MEFTFLSFNTLINQKFRCLNVMYIENITTNQNLQKSLYI